MTELELVTVRCPSCRRPVGTVVWTETPAARLRWDPDRRTVTQEPTTGGRYHWTPTSVADGLGELHAGRRARERERLADDVVVGEFYDYSDFPRGGITIADLEEHRDDVIVGWCPEHGDVALDRAELLQRARARRTPPPRAAYTASTN